MGFPLRRLARPLCAAAFILGAAACSPSGDTPAPADPHDLAEADAGAEDAPVTRRERQEILAEYNEALEKARETNGTGQPALWKLSDEDTTIYLFGTVHVLRPDLQWRSDEFSTAFESADKLVMEVDMESEEGLREAARDFQLKGLYGDGRRLSNEISPSDLKVINQALEPLGLPITVFDPMEPWMAAISIQMLALQQEGFDPNSGVEQTLIGEAREDGKTFGYLETAAVQADIFDKLPEDVQEEFLYETALTLEDNPQMLDQTVDEWADGDVTGLGALVANPDTGGGDGIYDALFIKRNTAWVPQIEAMLDEPGTVFIAVGAGHLAGPDSVVTLLRDKGYEVEGP